MPFTIIIPSRNPDNLFPCLEAICQHEESPQIIVVDDGLTRRPLADGLRYIPGVKPFIYARNVNEGIKSCSGDVVLLNDDAILQTPNGFTLLAQFSHEHPECGVVAPSTNVTGQRYQHPKFTTEQGWRYVDTVPYVCVYIRREALRTVGVLDERYCLDYGCEDADHIETMKRAGLKAAVTYNCFVDHGSLQPTFAKRDFRRNYELFKQKWRVR